MVYRVDVRQVTLELDVNILLPAQVLLAGSIATIMAIVHLIHALITRYVSLLSPVFTIGGNSSHSQTLFN